MPSIPDRLRPSLSRIAALLVGSLCAWATIRFKFDVPEELRSFATELLVAALVGGAGYLATHFGIATKVNPEDAASPGAAVDGKRKQQARKLGRAHAKIDALVQADVGVADVSAPDDPPTGGFRR